MHYVVHLFCETNSYVVASQLLQRLRADPELAPQLTAVRQQENLVIAEWPYTSRCRAVLRRVREYGRELLIEATMVRARLHTSLSADEQLFNICTLSRWYLTDQEHSPMALECPFPWQGKWWVHEQYLHRINNARARYPSRADKYSIQEMEMSRSACLLVPPQLRAKVERAGLRGVKFVELHAAGNVDCEEISADNDLDAVWVQASGYKIRACSPAAPSAKGLFGWSLLVAERTLMPQHPKLVRIDPRQRSVDGTARRPPVPGGPVAVTVPGVLWGPPCYLDTDVIPFDEVDVVSPLETGTNLAIGGKLFWSEHGRALIEPFLARPRWYTTGVRLPLETTLLDAVEPL